MKYIAMLLVAAGFYWAFADKLLTPKTEPVSLPARPGELSDVEKEYYVKVFDYAIATISADGQYDWKSSDTNNGVITAGELFTSKSGYTCRGFAEAFNIGGEQGQHQGIACKRKGADGWCRLKESDALTCALETPATAVANYNFPGADTTTPNIAISGGIGGIGGISIPSTPGGSRPSSPDMPGAPAGTSSTNKQGSGKGYADTVTGTAGGAAGPAAGTAKEWFQNTFR
ncbi:MAG: hypothetical protein ACN2B6_04385 [Rickettsiales bacterium]